MPSPSVTRFVDKKQFPYVSPLGRLSFRNACSCRIVKRSSRSHQIKDRIVSIRQPHVRPIVRGKVKARVEFGAKVSVTMVNGYAILERQSWDNFNEGLTLIETLET